MKKLILIVTVLLMQIIPIFADVVYQDHIKKEAIDLFEKASQLQKNKQFKKSRLLLDQAIKINSDFHHARLYRGLREDYIFLIKADCKISSKPYYSLGRELLCNNKAKHGRELLLKGGKIDNTGIIIAQFKKDSKVTSPPLKKIITNLNFSLLGGPSTFGRRDHHTPQIGYEVCDNTLYAFGFPDADKYSKAVVIIKYQNLLSESNTIKVKLDQLEAGAAYSKEHLEIKLKPVKKSQNHTFSQVKLEGEKDHSGVTILIHDPYGKNKGFKYETVTDKRGFFKIENIPNGDMYLMVSKPGYVKYDFDVQVNGQQFNISNTGSTSKTLFFNNPNLRLVPLEETIIPLYKPQKYKITYTVQTQKNVMSFTGAKVLNGQRIIKVNQMADWYRGGYHEANSVITFLNKNYRGPHIDMAFFHTTKGPFISRNSANDRKELNIALTKKTYSDVTKVTPEFDFQHEQPLVLGKTYIVKLNQKNGTYYAKFKLTKN